jgi:CxxC-x17-CxxC domain-containing protein
MYKKFVQKFAKGPSSGFGSDSRGGARGGSRGGSGYGRSGEPAEMHEARCSECGDNCLIPFKPSGNRPVYCKTCFKNPNERSAGSDRGPERSCDRPSFDRPSFGAGPSSASSDQISRKLDRIIELLEGILDGTEDEFDETDKPTRGQRKRDKRMGRD